LTLGPLAGLGDADCAEAWPAATITARRAATSMCARRARRPITKRIFDPAAPRRNVTEVTARWCAASPSGAETGAYGSSRFPQKFERTDEQEVRRC
jgi:hypothetical protein